MSPTQTDSAPAKTTGVALPSYLQADKLGPWGITCNR